MKISLICFSLAGNVTMERLCAGLQRCTGPDESFYEVQGFRKSRYLPESISMPCDRWAEERFRDSEAVIFIGATGIAVRSIAPLVASKKTDPAVLVIDEAGQYVISLLSGHLGGANELAKVCAEILQAVPVITTATDIEKRFAVDVFAKKNRCTILGMGAAKEVSAALLAGRTVGFYSEIPWDGDLPEGVLLCDKDGIPEDHGNSPECGFAITIHKSCIPFLHTTQIVPSVVTLGIGCRKGMNPAPIWQAVEQLLSDHLLYPEAVEKICSIDLKKEESGILSAAEQLKVPFETFSAEELSELPGSFTPSTFVSKVTGVDNVCERSAVKGSHCGKLIQSKTAGGGVTIAAAVREIRIQF